MNKLRGYAPDLTPIYQADIDEREQQLVIHAQRIPKYLNRAEKSSNPLIKMIHENAAKMAIARVRNLENQIKQLKEWIAQWSN